jgi:protocatechuate 3,4-dioxygenase beta subunit
MTPIQSRSFQARRRLLRQLGGVGVIALASPWHQALAALIPTPEQTAGPFRPLKPLESDADLTMVKGAKAHADGQIIQVTGRVLDVDGKPIRGAAVEVWQANARGRYDHPRDVNPEPLDPNFQGYARVLTDDDGRYRFKTVKPGAYPMNPMNPDAIRTPHIHFDVAGKRTHLVTQMYFPGEKLNATDRIFSAMGENGATTIARLLPPTDDMASSEMLFGWDIVLA